MARHSFFCIDAHTGGNPVRVVQGAVPVLHGGTMSARRQDFLIHHDWIRRALMFEPRGHDMMSGAIIYPPLSAEADAAILFIETSGCLPMCGHGLIGTVTVAIEHGLIRPRIPGRLQLDVPAGPISATYRWKGHKVTAVRFRNVPAWRAVKDLEVECPGLGPLRLDIAYGGNFYAIVEPQEGYPGLDAFSPDDILRLSPRLRAAVNAAVEVVHPDDPTIRGVSHVMWADAGRDGADGRNAVFYGERAIDRSPCGTGTSARMAQLAARGRLAPGDRFVHESIIGSRFVGHVEEATRVGPYEAIVPAIEGTAYVTGFNTIFVDEDEPFPQGFHVC
ncbi:MAG: 4-hydroxyproline epimerase [Rhodothalassiaceae bacterium]